jgi:hypothetical protein
MMHFAENRSNLVWDSRKLGIDIGPTERKLNSPKNLWRLKNLRFDSNPQAVSKMKHAERTSRLCVTFVYLVQGAGNEMWFNTSSCTRAETPAAFKFRLPACYKETPIKSSCLPASFRPVCLAVTSSHIQYGYNSFSYVHSFFVARQPYAVSCKTNQQTRAVMAQSVQRWATGWKIGVLGFDSRRGLGIFLFTTASRTVLGPTQPPIECVSGALFLGVKWPGRKADHSPPSSAEVKNEWCYTSTHTIRLHGVVFS